MITAILVSIFIFYPATSGFINADRLPKIAFLSVIAVVAGVNLVLKGSKCKFPLWRPWASYLGLLAVTGLFQTHVIIFLSRFSLDLIAPVIFWTGVNLRKRLHFKVMIVAVLFAGLLAWFAMLGIEPFKGNPELIAGIVVLATPLTFWLKGPMMLLSLGIWPYYLFQNHRRMAGLSILIALAIAYRVKSWIVLPVLFAGVTVLYFFGQGFLSGILERALWWHDVSGLIQDSSILGIGRGNAPAALYSLAEYRAGGTAKDILMFVHNDYLELLLEAGPIALVIFGWILVQVCRRSMVPSSLEMALQASLLTMAFRAFVHSPFNSPAEVAWFWLLAGIYWRLKSENSRSSTGILIGVAPGGFEHHGVPEHPSLGSGGRVRQKEACFSGVSLPLGLPLPVSPWRRVLSSWRIWQGSRFVFRGNGSIPYVYRGEEQPRGGMGYDGEKTRGNKGLAGDS